MASGRARQLEREIARLAERLAEAVASRLRDPDLWLDPLVAREAIGGRTGVWDDLLRDWVIELARRLGRPSAERALRPGEPAAAALAPVPRALRPVPAPGRGRPGPGARPRR